MGPPLRRQPAASGGAVAPRYERRDGALLVVVVVCGARWLYPCTRKRAATGTAWAQQLDQRRILLQLPAWWTRGLATDEPQCVLTRLFSSALKFQLPVLRLPPGPYIVRPGTVGHGVEARAPAPSG